MGSSLIPRPRYSTLKVWEWDSHGSIKDIKALLPFADFIQSFQVCCIAGNFRGRKLFVKFAEVFSTKFESVVSFGTAKATNLQKFSQWKSFFFQQFAKVFSLESFPLYGSNISNDVSEVFVHFKRMFLIRNWSNSWHVSLRKGSGRSKDSPFEYSLKIRAVRILHFFYNWLSLVNNGTCVGALETLPQGIDNWSLVPSLCLEVLATVE